MSDGGRMLLSGDRYPLTAERLIDFVCRRRHVSFAELLRAFDGARGNEWLEIPDTRIVLWPGVSEALASLLASETVVAAIEPTPCHFLVYFADGEVPRLPIAKRRRRYKSPHWLPVTFSPRRA